MKIVFFVVFTLCSTLMFGQQQRNESEVDFNRQRIVEALYNNDCARAQVFYNAYRRSGGSSDSNFQTYIDNCFRQQENESEMSRNRRLVTEALNDNDCTRARLFFYAYIESGGTLDPNLAARIRDCFAQQEDGRNQTPEIPIPPSDDERMDSRIFPPHTTTSRVFASFGIKGGLNLSTISNNTTGIHFSPQIKPGFHGGILFNLRFGSQTGSRVNRGIFGLQPELLFSNQGFMVDGNAIHFNYITVPLMIKLNFGRSEFSGNFNLEFGPSFSYLVAVSPNSTVIGNEYDIRLSDLTNGRDIGVSVGMGYETRFGLIIGARYTHGLSDMANNLLWRNSVIAISLGWKFN